MVLAAGEHNEEHYFVGTQDKLLRTSLGEVKGGATLFLSVNGLHITQPTDTQKWLAGQVIHFPADCTEPQASAAHDSGQGLRS